MLRNKFFITGLMFFGLLVLSWTVVAKSDADKIVGDISKGGTKIVRSESSSEQKSEKKPQPKVTKKVAAKTKKVAAKKEVVKKEVGTKKPVTAKGTVSMEPVDAEDDENNVIVAESETDVADAEVSSNAATLENQVIDSMLKNDFPEKSEFIADEDKKSGVVLGKNDASVLKTAAPTLKEDSGLGGMLLNTVVMTIVLVALIVGMAYVWRYLQGKTFSKMLGKPGKLKIVSEQIISQKSKLLVIDCFGKKYLLGATENNIQMLADIDLDAVVSAESDTNDDEEVTSNDTIEESGGADSNDNKTSETGFAQNILSQFSAKKESDLATTPGKMFVPLSQISDVEINRVKSLKTSERIKERMKDMKKLA